MPATMFETIITGQQVMEPDEEIDLVVRTWTDTDGIYADDVEKANPWHDPTNGQFTSGPMSGNPMIRTDPPPKKTKIAYKVFVAKNGKLYPPMVANPDGQDTPVGVWLDASEGKLATDKDGNPITNTLGRKKVKAGGKGTQGGSGTLAYRPGWHLGELPIAEQFYTKDKTTGEKKQKKNFVWAECEIAADINYQEKAMSYGYTKNGKFQHSLAGLPELPKDGFYTYRTNPNPNTKPWYITGSMKVNRILTDAETNKILRDHGIEPMKRDGGELDLSALGFTQTNFIGKSDAADKPFSIFKTDDDKRLVFGWASIAITVNGEQLEDRQQDIIDPEDLEEAAYEYVLNFRDTGEEHIPTMRKKGKLVESCVFTAEKQKAMGIPEGILPVGWWIGFKIDDDDAWNRVKSGHYKMFSIEGKANREPVEKTAPIAKSFGDVLKANPYHDAKGRFASAGAAGGATTGTAKAGIDKLAAETAANTSDYAEKELVKRLTSEEGEAIAAYTEEIGFEMNKMARGLAIDEDAYDYDEVLDHALNLESALNKASLPQDAAVFRGSSFDTATESTGLSKKDIQADPQKLVGKTITEKGFMSTTPDEGLAEEYAEGMVYHIKLPAGSKAVLQNSLNEYLDGPEITVNRNSEFKVVAAENKGGNTHVYMEYSQKKTRVGKSFDDVLKSSTFTNHRI